MKAEEGPFLPYSRQWIDEGDIESVTQALKSPFLTTGPEIELFEKELCEATGAKYAIAVSSGTAALHCAYYALGLQPGDEIITSPLTFAATSNAALFLGASVKFIDIDPETGLMDLNLLEAAITPKTKIIVPVDYGGHPVDYEAVNRIAQKHSIKVCGDAAHSMGAKVAGARIGELTETSILSFHPVKSMTSAEGGAILTANKEVAQRAILFRSHGIEKNGFCSSLGAWYKEMLLLGYNYRLSDIQAALGRSQLKKLDFFIQRRRELAKRYLEKLSGDERITLPTEKEGVESAYHLFVIRIRGDEKRRHHLYEALKTRNLGVQIHYIPVYYHPLYRERGFAKGLCPHAESFYESCISIPLFPQMTNDDVDSVVQRLHSALDETCS